MANLQKVLFLAANPRDTPQLRLNEEVREIQASLRYGKYGQNFDLQQRWAIRTKDLRQALLDVEPQVVHFSGHGASSGGIFLEDDLGKPKLIPPKALANLFELCSSSVECVILNACYSEIQADAIAQHIDYVVGMRQAIGDKAAIGFSKGFYDGLGADRSIEESYSFGCNAIELENISEYLIPILKARKSRGLYTLSEDWSNEAYVSLHLVQRILEESGLPSSASQESKKAMRN
ncbi:MAG: CHAT domain-containing protein [Leptolyngbya sp. SIO4C1]|nr:CHAT domain-containing protein [Leptolyngbya sp. SIO4C1]